MAEMQGVGDVSMSQRSYEVLRDRLIMLDIEPGGPINEAGVAAELGVGRTPVREALKRLEIDHLVVAYPRRGTFATPVDITDLAEISELRAVLEPLAARRAASHPRTAVHAQMRKTARDIEALDPRGSRRELMEFDLGVHRMIYAAADNAHLQETLVRLDNLATRIWCLVLDRLPSVTEHIREHVDLLDAIADGDKERAARLAGEHVTHFERTVRSCL